MKHALVMTGVVKTYGRRRALDGLDLAIPAGVVCGLIGSNGAGKTTALAVAAGLIAPRAGAVNVLGRGPFNSGRDAGLLSLLPQDSLLPPESTVYELMNLYAQLQGVPSGETDGAVRASVARVHLADRLHAPARTLSHGMKRRVMIAQAFLGDPELVLLDEPMNGLDPREAAGARDLLATWRGTRTVVISSHNLAELERICDYVVVLEKGRAVQAGPLSAVTGDRHVLWYELDGTPVPLDALRDAIPLADFTLTEDRARLRCQYDAATLGARDVNGRVLPVLLRAGVGIAGIRQGDGLESAYLQRKDTP